MKSVSEKDFRANLSEHLSEVADSNALLVVKRGSKKSVVFLKFDEFRSWKETAYLLGTPANAKSLLESIAQVAGAKLLTKDGKPC